MLRIYLYLFSLFFPTFKRVKINTEITIAPSYFLFLEKIHKFLHVSFVSSLCASNIRRQYFLQTPIIFDQKPFIREKRRRR